MSSMDASIMQIGKVHYLLKLLLIPYPDQMLHSLAASDLDLHHLQKYVFWSAKHKIN